MAESCHSLLVSQLSFLLQVWPCSNRTLIWERSACPRSCSSSTCPFRAMPCDERSSDRAPVARPVLQSSRTLGAGRDDPRIEHGVYRRHRRECRACPRCSGRLNASVVDVQWVIEAYSLLLCRFPPCRRFVRRSVRTSADFSAWHHAFLRRLGLVRLRFSRFGS